MPPRRTGRGRRGGRHTAKGVSHEREGFTADVYKRQGYAFEFFKSPAGYLVLVLVPLGVLIGLQIRCFLRLLGEGRSRKLDALAAERLKAEHMQVELCRPQSADRSDIPVCTRVVDPTASHVRAAILRDLPVIVLEPPKRGKHAR